MSIQSNLLITERSATRRIDWSPYLIGVGIGVLSWIAFAIAKEPLGITTALSRVAAPVAATFLGADAVAKNNYWNAMPFSWDYSVLFLVGIMAGAFVSSLVTGTFHFEIVPRFWRERFGGSIVKRLVASFLGGAMLMYGARLAGGCTSGHGISGGLQLALSSWVFLAVTFASALAASALVFGRK
jgi:uncharacterized membrane protein YedE/YeeE